MLVLLVRLRALPERIRFWLYPRLARFYLNLATKRARRNLSESSPIRVLVDNTVLDLAITHETRWISTGTAKWGDQNTGTGYLARVPVHKPGSKSGRYLNITYLTGIAYLARLGFVELCQSAELEDEQVRQPAGRFRGYGYFDYSLFAGINMESVDGHVCATIGPNWLHLPSVAEQQRTRLSQIDDHLFHELNALLKEQLGPKKGSQDAWHIRTAERHGLFCFLTTDRPLLKACKSLRKKEPLRSMMTRVMSPQELGNHLGIHPVAPVLLSYDDASWFVRIDHTMPEDRRRRRSEYG